MSLFARAERMSLWSRCSRGIGREAAAGPKTSPRKHQLVGAEIIHSEEVAKVAHVGDRHVEFLWLLPITEAERDFKVADGLEAMEARFCRSQSSLLGD